MLNENIIGKEFLEIIRLRKKLSQERMDVCMYENVSNKKKGENSCAVQFLPEISKDPISSYHGGVGFKTLYTHDNLPHLDNSKNQRNKAENKGEKEIRKEKIKETKI